MAFSNTPEAIQKRSMPFEVRKMAWKIIFNTIRSVEKIAENG
jgi:hypothetical protein